MSLSSWVNRSVEMKARVPDLSTSTASHSGYLEIKNDRFNTHKAAYLEC